MSLRPLRLSILKTDTILSGILIVTAISLSYAYRRKTIAQQTAQEPVFVAGWRDIARAGMGIESGPANARIVILEFSDFQCPFCKLSHKSVRELMRRFPNDVSYTFVQFPLSNHPQANSAARVALCANEQKVFVEMADMLFENSDSLGIKPWNHFAKSVVGDTGQFNSCVARTGKSRVIEAGLRMGKSIEVRGTPTVFINGWRFPHPPTLAEMNRVATDILGGKPPFPAR
jgi:protein-disulfide isomerase